MQALLISLTTFIAIMALGSAILIGLAERRRQMLDRLERLAGAGHSAAGQKAKMLNLIDSIGSRVISGTPSRKLQALLAQAGFRSQGATRAFLGIKVLLFIAGLLIFGLIPFLSKAPMQVRLLCVFIGATLLFFIPNVVIHSRRQRRSGEIRHHLPDAVDLLEICVSAGMGLDMAWNSVTDEIRSVCTILADEMALTNLEINLGVQRAIAMRHMAERTGAEELSSLVAVLVQSERLGTPISDALRAYATSMRELRSQRAEERAEKMAVNLLVPMVLFIFPAVLAVAAGPAVIKVADLLSH